MLCFVEGCWLCADPCILEQVMGVSLCLRWSYLAPLCLQPQGLRVYKICLNLGSQAEWNIDCILLSLAIVLLLQWLQHADMNVLAPNAAIHHCWDLGCRLHKLWRRLHPPMGLAPVSRPGRCVTSAPYCMVANISKVLSQTEHLCTNASLQIA